jgi:valyl-tRNA synthetase
VYLHSLVRTGSGEKMSKSKGTGLDPVALNEQYGTDAMRFCLASMAAPGTDIVLSEDRLLGARSFANKIWNAARFLFVNLEKYEQVGAKLEQIAAPEVRAAAPYGLAGEVPLADQWLFARLAETIAAVNQALNTYYFHEAAQQIYQFFWGDFCDWYIEWVKPDLQSANAERAEVAWKNLFAAFDAALRLLHPVMPFLTEELWHQIPQRTDAKSIALDAYPMAAERWKNSVALDGFAFLQDVIKSLREIRAQMKLDPKKKVKADFSSAEDGLCAFLADNLDAVLRLGILAELNLTSEKLEQSGGIVRSTGRFDLRIPYSDVVDVVGESARIKKEIEGLAKAIQSKEKQLSNEVFRSRAPEKVIHDMEGTLAEQKVELQKLNDRLAQLGG